MYFNNTVLTNTIEIGKLESLWYAGGGNTGLGTFIHELDRILIQIENNIVKISNYIKLTESEIKLMYYMPNDEYVSTLPLLWYSSGGSIYIDSFISELNRILIQIANNISKINIDNNKLNQSDIDRMYHIHNKKYYHDLGYEYDVGTLLSLWLSGGGAKNLSSSFVIKLDKILVKFADDICKIG
jgi:hypothetical protein